MGQDRCTCSQLIYNTGGKTIQWGKDSLFNKRCWENWTATCKNMKIGHSLIPYKKISSKWIKDVNVQLESIKLLEENIGSKLYDISLSNVFLTLSLQAREIKQK